MRKQTRRENWDHYWKDKSGSRFTRKSWSKIRMTALLEKHITEGIRVLDAGCGSGFFSEWFLSRNCRVYTLDYSADALALAREKTQGRSEAYLERDLLDPAFGREFENSFDLIFTDGLFEHFPPEDQQKIMRNFTAVKKNTGVIATFVPNRYSWWEIIRPLVMPGIHEVPFTPASAEALHAGLKIQEKGGLNVLPFGLSPERLLGSRFGMLLYCFAK